MQSVAAGGQRTVNGRGPRDGRNMQRVYMEGNWRESGPATSNRNNRASHGSTGGKSPQPASQQRESAVPNVELAVNDHAFRFMCCLLGHVVRVKARDGHVFEGVLHSWSQKTNELALTLVHDRCLEERIEKAAREQNEGDDASQSNQCDGVPHEDDLAGVVTFHWSDVLKIEKSGVELTDFLGLSSTAGAPLTDAEIATTLTSTATVRNEKQLVPFFDADGECELEGPPLSLDDGSGWSAADMIRENEKKFHTVTDYDETLYTTALQKVDTVEFKARDERAKRLADAISRNTSARAIEAENDENADEEMHYSAVYRPPDRRAPQSANRRNDRDRTAAATPPRSQPPRAADSAASTTPAASTPAAGAAATAPANQSSALNAQSPSVSAAPAAAASATPTQSSAASASNSSTTTSTTPSTSRTAFNPNAREFVFNPRASSFAVPASAPAAPAPNEPAQFNTQNPIAPSMAGVRPPPANVAPNAAQVEVANIPGPAANSPYPTGQPPVPTLSANPPQGRAPPVAAPMYTTNAFPQSAAFAAGPGGQPQAAWMPQPVWTGAPPAAGQPTWVGPATNVGGNWMVDMQQVPPEASVRVNAVHNQNNQYVVHAAPPANSYSQPPGAARDTPMNMQQQSQQPFQPTSLQQPVQQQQQQQQPQVPSSQQPAPAYQQPVQQVGTVSFAGQQPAPYPAPGHYIHHPNSGASPNTQPHPPVSNVYQQQLVGTMYAQQAGGAMQPHLIMLPENAQSLQQDSQMVMQQQSIMHMPGGGPAPALRGPAPPYAYQQQPISVPPGAEHPQSAPSASAPPHPVPTQHPGPQPPVSHPQTHGSNTGNEHGPGSKRRAGKQNNSGYRGGPNAAQNSQAFAQQPPNAGSGNASLNSSAGATGLTASGRPNQASRQRNVADSADQPHGRDTPPQPAPINSVAGNFQPNNARPNSAGPFRPVAPVNQPHTIVQQPTLTSVPLHAAQLVQPFIHNPSFIDMQAYQQQQQQAMAAGFPYMQQLVFSMPNYHHLVRPQQMSVQAVQNAQAAANANAVQHGRLNSTN